MKPDGRRTNGGKRAKCGRKISSNVQTYVTLKPDTAAKLNRLATAQGLKKTKGGKPFLGTVIDQLVEKVETPEPEYLKLAREAGALHL